jgi:hypothetical protein
MCKKNIPTSLDDLPSSLLAQFCFKSVTAFAIGPQLVVDFKDNTHPRHWLLMPINLATQEAKIRKIAVPNQPKQIVHETHSQKSPSQKRLVEWLNV